MKKHCFKANFKSRRDLTYMHDCMCRLGLPIRAPKSPLILGDVCTAEQLMVMAWHGMVSKATRDNSARELIIKPCPLAARTCCTFSPTTFSLVQFSAGFQHGGVPGS